MFPSLSKASFYQRKDGIVEIDSTLCNGCRLCVTSCPYQAPQYDPETNKVTRCQMCYPRQDRGLFPACVEACTTGALATIDLNNSYSGTVRYIPGFKYGKLTKPSVLFYPLREIKRYFSTIKKRAVKFVPDRTTQLTASGEKKCLFP